MAAMRGGSVKKINSHDSDDESSIDIAVLTVIVTTILIIANEHIAEL